MPSFRPPLNRRWLFVPLAIWALLAEIGIESIASPVSIQLFYGPQDPQHWVPWGRVVPPILVGLAALLPFFLKRLETLRRPAFFLSLGLGLASGLFLIKGLVGGGENWPASGSRREWVALTKRPADWADPFRPIRIELGAGVRLNYSPVLFADSDERTLPRAPKAPRPEAREDLGELSPRTFENIEAFARAFGHLRYFCPSDSAEFAPWDRLAIEGTLAVAEAKDATDLARRLGDFFAPYAPQASFRTLETQNEPVRVPDGAVNLVRWCHDGAYDLSVRTRNAEGPKRATRLAAIITSWNLLFHLSPYLEPVKAPWEEALSMGLREAASATHDLDYYSVLRRFLARFRDAHIWPHYSDLQRRFKSLHLRVQSAEGRVFVTGVRDGLTPRLRIGSEILYWNGESSFERLQRLGLEKAETNPGHRTRYAEDAYPLAASPDPVTIKGLSPSGEAFELKLTPGGRYESAAVERLQELRPGLFYIDADRPPLDGKTFHRKLQGARGLVVDLRGYPSDTFIYRHVFPYLTDTLLLTPPMQTPVVCSPDRATWTWKAWSRTAIVPGGSRFPFPVTFLCSGNAISNAETVLAVVEEYKLGPIVGEASAGSNGNVAIMTLPGDFKSSWTALSMPRHRIGIQPTHPVKPTPKGLQEGRDEVLERAISLIQESGK